MKLLCILPLANWAVPERCDCMVSGKFTHANPHRYGLLRILMWEMYVKAAMLFYSNPQLHVHHMLINQPVLTFNIQTGDR